MKIVAANRESVPTTCEPAWKAAMRAAIRDPEELCRRLELPAELAARAKQAANQFPLFVPAAFAAKMKIGDPRDPLLRQVLPLADELDEVLPFTVDPVGDAAAALRPGLLQKYQGRVLLVTTGACAIHCRYCFRRHYPYHEDGSRATRWRQAIEAIHEDDAIDEVLLSGGDPLTLDDDLLAELVDQVADAAHVQRLRIHTRLPVVIPERVDDNLLHWINATRLSIVVVIHTNHAQELDEPVSAACERLRRSGATLLNQAVLLDGVNDTVAAQEALCRRLVNIGVTPYYLHRMDRVAGAAHFDAPAELGVGMIRDLRKRLPGYAVPRFVEEVAGEPNKRVLA